MGAFSGAVRLYGDGAVERVGSGGFVGGDFESILAVCMKDVGAVFVFDDFLCDPSIQAFCLKKLNRRPKHIRHNHTLEKIVHNKHAPTRTPRPSGHLHSPKT